MRILPCILALLLASGPALAQDAPASQRQILADLAYVLGEAHALRQACAGPEDQHWRTRMVRLLEAERGDRIFEQQLRDTFNEGYRTRETRYSGCSARTRDAEAEVAARGQILAQRLAERR